MKDLIKALQIFAKYTDTEWPTNCEHDILYIMVSPNQVSDEDKVRLEELGFDADEGLDNFSSFKYGSA